MSAFTVFTCALDAHTLETYGQVVETRGEPGRDEGHCDRCGEWLALDDEARAYEQACGYCGAPLYGAAS